MVASCQQLTVRPIAPSDRQLIVDSLDYTSGETLYRRFHASKTSLTARELDYLTQVDHDRHVALVVVDEESGLLAGVARYIRSCREPWQADMAILITDPYQGHGVGRMLFSALAENARANGLRAFTADVQGANRAMVALLYAVSEEVELLSRDGLTNCFRAWL